MGLSPALGRGPVGVDAAVVIYYVEVHPEFVRFADPIFDAAREGERELVTSSLTLLEVLVKPYRAENDGLAWRFETVLTQSPGLTLVDIDRDPIRTAARLRAGHGVRTPDALQLAAALSAGCSAFVTNDRKIPSVAGLPVVQLPDATI